MAVQKAQRFDFMSQKTLSNVSQIYDFCYHNKIVVAVELVSATTSTKAVLMAVIISKKKATPFVHQRTTHGQ